VTYTDRDLSNPKTQTTFKEAASPAWIQDVLSAIYFVRAQKLNEGDVIPVAIRRRRGLQYRVIVGKREEVKLDLGVFKTVRLDAKVSDGAS
jgi:hypothetical protein